MATLAQPTNCAKSEKYDESPCETVANGSISEGVSEEREHILVNGGYGWAVVIAVAFANAHTWGIASSYSTFLAYYQDHNQVSDGTTLEYTFIGGFQYAQPCLIAPVASKIIKHWGSRNCIWIGVIIQTGSLIGASYASKMWHLFLAEAVGFSWGLGLISFVCYTVVPQWFEKNRSAAVGITAAGTGIGGLLYSLVSGHIIETLGVGWALRFLAILSLVVNLAASPFIRDRNDHIHPDINFFNIRLLMNSAYALLAIFSFINMLAEIIILTQIPSYGTTVLGLSTSQSSLVGAMVSVGQMLGRMFFGFVSDYVGRLNIATTITVLAGLWSLIIWPNANSLGVLILYSLLVGGCAGAFWSTITPVLSDVIGIKRLPDSYGMLLIVLVVPSTFSPAISTWLVQSQDGAYLGTQMFSGFMFIFSGLFLWIVRCWRALYEQEHVGEEKDEAERAEGLGLSPTWNPVTLLRVTFQLVKV